MVCLVTFKVAVFMLSKNPASKTQSCNIMTFLPIALKAPKSKNKRNNKKKKIEQQYYRNKHVAFIIQ